MMRRTFLQTDIGRATAWSLYFAAVATAICGLFWHMKGGFAPVDVPLLGAVSRWLDIVPMMGIFVWLFVMTERKYNRLEDHWYRGVSLSATVAVAGCVPALVIAVWCIVPTVAVSTVIIVALAGSITYFLEMKSASSTRMEDAACLIVMLTFFAAVSVTVITGSLAMALGLLCVPMIIQLAVLPTLFRICARAKEAADAELEVLAAARKEQSAIREANADLLNEYDRLRETVEAAKTVKASVANDLRKAKAALAAFESRPGFKEIVVPLTRPMR